ncbi:MAG: TerC family protein [Bacteroidota bacterium]
MEYLFTIDSLVSFFVLVILEIVLGIDNVIFVSIIINRLPEKDHKRARFSWMVMGIIVRSILLFGLTWLLTQKGKHLFTIFDKGFDLSSLVMLGGGLFLIFKTVKEIHYKLEGEADAADGILTVPLSFGKALIEILLIDMVFSFDSIITAGGTAKHVEIMIAAVVIAMVVMFLFSPAIARYIHNHPTIKMLALSFLVMIGFVLIVEGWGSERLHDLQLKNYVYFAMAFSFAVEMMNMRERKKRKPLQLREPTLKENLSKH